MDMRTAITIAETAASNAWMRPWLTGQCFDFALALAEKMPDAEFVAIGDQRFPDHVGLMKDGVFYDVRGALNRAEFRSGVESGGDAPIRVIPRSTVELHAGVSGISPPYNGIKEIAAARKAVRLAYPAMKGRS